MAATIRVSPLRSVISFPLPVTLTDCFFHDENIGPILDVVLDDDCLKQCVEDRWQLENETKQVNLEISVCFIAKINFQCFS